MKKIALKDTNPGDTVMIAGQPYNVLDTDFQGGAFLLSRDILFEAAFDKDNCNNWATSSLRKKLNGDFFQKIAKEIGEENIIEIERDLTSEDGLKDYRTCKDKITLITCNEYRRYRYQIPDKDDWWWTATAYSTPYSGHSYNARLVSTDGSLSGSHAYDGLCGVVPGLCLLRSFEAELVEETPAEP